MTSRPNGPEPLVSVIMPARNREHSIRRAIDSVLAQTYRNLELIVVDDGSTDGTAKAAADYGDRLILIRQPPAGPYSARNNAVARSKGELIAFADSDDAWLPRKLELQVALMRRPEVGLVFGDTIHVAEAKEDSPFLGTKGFSVSPPRRGRAAAALAWGNFVPTTTVLTRRSCLDEIGGFRTGNISADHLAWLQIALRHELDYVDEPVCIYTFNRESISFDIGRSIAARIALAAAEPPSAMGRQGDKLLRRLIFNLSLHLALAALRGKARSVDRPLRLAARNAWRAAGLRSLGWSAGFAVHQLRLRARRLRRRTRSR